MSEVPPINQTLPDRLRSTQRRLSEMQPALAASPPSTANAYVDYMARRAGRGASTLSYEDSLRAIKAANTGESQTPIARANPFDLPGNFVRNLGEATHVIPRFFFPTRNNPLYGEATAVLQGQEPQGEATNALESIGQFLGRPGIRLIPGAYVGETMLAPEGGGVAELARNPVYTALDVLPYAKAGAKATPAYRTAAAEYAQSFPAKLAEHQNAQVRTLTGQGVNPGITEQLYRPPTPIRTAMTRTGAGTPNRLGRATQAAGNWFTQSQRPTVRRVGELGAEMFGLGERGRVNKAAVSAINQANVDISRVANADDVTLARMRESGVPAQAKLADLMEAKQKLAQDFPDMAQLLDDQAAPLRQTMETDPSKLTGREAEFAGRYRSLQDDLKRYTAEQFPEDVVIYQGHSDITRHLNDELLPTGRARDIRRAEDKYIKAGQRQHIAENRLDEARQAIIEGRGVVTGPREWRKGMGGTTQPGTISQLSEDFARVALDLDNPMHRAFEADVVKYNKGLQSFMTADSARIMAKGLSDMNEAVKAISQRKSLIEPFADTLANAKVNIRSALKDMKVAADKTPAQMAKAVANAAEGVRKQMGKETAIPARWQPTLQPELVKRMEAELARRGETGVDVTADIEAARLGEFADIQHLTKADQAVIMRDIASTLQELKAQGLDPIFVHRATPEQIARLDYPNVSPRISGTTQVKERMWNGEPGVNSPFLALEHQAMELVRDMAQREIVDTMDVAFAKSRGDLIAQAEATGLPSPGARRWVRDNYVDWPPKGAKYAGRPKVQRSIGGNEQLMIPKTLGTVLDQMLEPPLKALAVFDPVMKVFRTALLPLSPRWQVYNLLGGSLLMTAVSPTAWRKFGEAHRQLSPMFEVMRKTAKGEAHPRASTVPRGAAPTAAGMASTTVPEGIIREMSKQHPLSPPRQLAARNWLAGNKMAQLIKQAGGKLAKVPELSYAMNSYWDDMVRTMVSLDALDRSMAASKKAGIGPDDATRLAEVEAIRQTRKVMQNWDQLLPLERQVIRSVFPFYSWAKFIVGQTMRYPFDHPIRTAVMASFARAEIEDRGTALPDTFNHLFQVGGINDDGTASFISTSGLNPWADVGDWMTLEGLVGNTNPVISATLTALGVEPAQGGPMLYPDLVYDPETGGLKADKPGFFESLMETTIPQTRLVGMMTNTREWADLVQRDPKAARRQMLSAIGIPTIYQQRNVPQEIFKAEQNRAQGFRDEWNRALREGTTDAFARKYPEVVEAVARLKAMNEAGQLAQYQS